MSDIAASRSPHQHEVDSYFEANASYWEDVYRVRGLLPHIYQRRHALALSWIAQLPLPSGSRALDIGSGSGLVSTALAQAGYAVTAVDPVPAMVARTRENAVRWGLASRLRVMQGDAHALPFATNSFDLIVALGVLPWLHAEQKAVQEMARVLKPGKYLLLSADNLHSLNRILDPVSTPLLAPLRRLTKAVLQRLAPRRSAYPSTKRHTRAELGRLLADRGLLTLRSAGVGFGPFTIWGHRGFPEAASIWIDQHLQRLADRGSAPLGSTGSQHLVLARKTSERVRVS